MRAVRAESCSRWRAIFPLKTASGSRVITPAWRRRRRRTCALNPESVERGRMLANSGDPAARIPACMACHDTSALEVYPRLQDNTPPIWSTGCGFGKAD